MKLYKDIVNRYKYHGDVEPKHRSRSKYRPHQGTQERERRRAQTELKEVRSIK